MDIKRINLYYFSGTGNTLLACRKMKEAFEARGVETRLYAMEKETPSSVDLGSCIGLAFPVAVFTTYPFVMRFIKGLPESNGTKIFMLDTMGGFSAGIRTVVRAILKRKGYDTIGSSQVVMPDNFWPAEEKEKSNPDIIKKGMETSASYAESILKGISSWKQFPVLPHLFYPVSQFLFTLPSFTKKAIKFNREKCIKCGLCSRLCPVGNIVMHEYPVLDNKCEVCVRCVSFCPKGALYRKKQGEHVYKAVKAEELL